MKNTEANLKSKIAIVVPVYNAGRKLKKCLRSLSKQTYRNIEIILIDDGSTDCSPKICDKFAKNDDRVRVVHQENCGCFNARKKGVYTASNDCEYLAFCDADDCLKPNALEKLLLAAIEYDADLVTGQTSRRISLFGIADIGWKSSFRAPCLDIKQPVAYNHEEILDKLYVSCFGISNYPASLCAKLYKTELVRKAIDFKPIVKFFAEDLSVTIRILPEVKRLVLIPDEVYYYYTGGFTSRYMATFWEDCVAMYRCKTQYALMNPMPQDVTKLIGLELKNITWSHLLQCQRHGMSDDELVREIEKVLNTEELKTALKYITEKMEQIDIVTELLQKGDLTQILEHLRKQKDSVKTRIKRKCASFYNKRTRKQTLLDGGFVLQCKYEK